MLCPRDKRKCSEGQLSRWLEGAAEAAFSMIRMGAALLCYGEVAKVKRNFAILEKKREIATRDLVSSFSPASKEASRD